MIDDKNLNLREGCIFKKSERKRSNLEGGGSIGTKKNFFAFLDDSGHVLKLVFESGKKCRTGRTSIPPNWENSHFILTLP